MSEVSIEKKSGFPWWLALLGLLLLGALAWWLIDDRDGATPVATNDAAPAVVANEAAEEDEGLNVAAAENEPLDNAAAAVDNTVEGAVNTADNAVEGAENAVTDTTTAAATTGAPITDLLAIVDTQNPSEYAGRTVTLAGAPVQLAGDKYFWIGPSAEQKMLVVPDTGVADNMNVAQRQRLNITGEIVRIDNWDQAVQRWNLDKNAITPLTNKTLYVRASRIEMDQR